jgi:ATP-binding cassette subfamily D (ALD) long-chain fatty acid import protein
MVDQILIADPTHRPSLMKYHTQLLTLNGEGTGRWSLTRLGTAEERLSVGREIALLEQKLADVEKWEKRVAELEHMLGAESFEESSDPIEHDGDHDSVSEVGGTSENGSEVAITESMLRE